MEPGPLAWATGILHSPFESAPTVSEWPLAGSRGPCRGWELGGLRVCAMRLVPVPVCVLALPQFLGGGQASVPAPPPGARPSLVPRGLCLLLLGGEDGPVSGRVPTVQPGLAAAPGPGTRPCRSP